MEPIIENNVKRKKLPRFPICVEITPGDGSGPHNVRMIMEDEPYPPGLTPPPDPWAHLLAAPSDPTDAPPPVSSDSRQTPDPPQPAPSASLPRETHGPGFEGPASGPAHHGRCCAVCSHPEREAIEADFLRWRSPELIAEEFKIANRSSIYRHAHAENLFHLRKRQLGRALEYVLEFAELVTPDSADVIVSAARVYAHLDEDGKWIESPRTNFLYAGPASPLTSAGDAPLPNPLGLDLPVGKTRRVLSQARPPADHGESNPETPGIPRKLKRHLKVTKSVTRNKRGTRK